MPRISRSTGLALALVAAIALVAGCGYRGGLERTDLPSAAYRRLDTDSEYLKAHMKSGAVYVLDHWSVDSTGAVAGWGTRFNAARDTVETGNLAFFSDSVAIFETNRLTPSYQVAAMTITSAASITGSVLCLNNPKACFGSCPTFYMETGGEESLVAEGFSGSVAPSLEATDVDALPESPPERPILSLTMKNEAYETHVVRGARLLHFERGEGERVYWDVGGGFRVAGAPVAPRRCTGPEGDCTALLAARDGAERLSAADSTDLAAKERVVLEFDRPAGDSLGIVLAARQSLLSTYLFYQALAWMGRSAGDWFAAVERNPGFFRRLDPGGAIGGIEVLVESDGGEWVVAGEAEEYGPLARDVHLIPLPGAAREPGASGAAAEGRPVRVALRMAKGAWRIDFVGLASLGGRAVPDTIDPAALVRGGRRDANARHRLTDRAAALTTLPGDEYTLLFDLPATERRREIFLETRGYYLEWMRGDWLAEEDPVRLGRFLYEPAASLREIAPAYKKVEPGMERAFWSSRYAPRNPD